MHFMDVHKNANCDSIKTMHNQWQSPYPHLKPPVHQTELEGATKASEAWELKRKTKEEDIISVHE